jgi:hypothetical protein
MTPIASATGDVAAIVVAIATVGLLIAASIAGWIANKQLVRLTQQLEDQRTAEGRRRVYEHLAQLFDRDFIETDTDAQRLFNTRPVPDDDTWEGLWKQKSDQEKARIVTVMNFYEVVAGEYNDDGNQLIDKATADKALTVIASRMWVQAEGFARWFRRYRSADLAYADWERLHDTVSATKAPRPAATGEAPTKGDVEVRPDPSTGDNTAD